jgi:hypothetical protein
MNPVVTIAPYAVAIALGLATAAFDSAAPFGDDTAKVTLSLWAASAGSLGLAFPRRPWRWAVLVGPWTPALYLMLYALGRPDKSFHPIRIDPDTTATALVLIPLSLAVCAAAAYAGAVVRRSFVPAAA